MENKALGCIFVLLVFLALLPEPQAAFNGFNRGKSLKGSKRSFQVGKGFVNEKKPKWSPEDLKDFVMKRQLCDAAERMGC